MDFLVQSHPDPNPSANHPHDSLSLPLPIQSGSGRSPFPLAASPTPPRLGPPSSEPPDAAARHLLPHDASPSTRTESAARSRGAPSPDAVPSLLTTTSSASPRLRPPPHRTPPRLDAPLLSNADGGSLEPDATADGYCYVETADDQE
ncbi:pectinesterase inhibitor 10 [Triticum aestivum]|uniref:pectinesterase inhibitor 10 n=1 Tax=Triticum aestivum TaxID=4565 RepID=UPI001D031541|nr:pectinesterase inhibitor 10-like [Triticum aestivum]